jgi:hypothetical protein
MDARVQVPKVDDPSDASVADLFHKLIDDGRSMVGAEVNLYKQIAAYRASKAKNGIVALVAAVLLLNAALVAFFVSLVMGLDNFLGPIGAGLAVLAVTGLIGFLLVRYGAGKLAVLGGDQEEKAALAAGEQRA